MQFWGYCQFMQIRQRIFNCTDIQIMHFILDKILKLLTYYTPIYRLVVAKLCDLKNSPVFWPTLYIYTSVSETIRKPPLVKAQTALKK